MIPPQSRSCAQPPRSGAEGGSLFLIFNVGARMCALPVGHVAEIMRPLPVEPVFGAPEFVLGLAVIRGEPVPVCDAGKLLGVEGAQPGRFVAVFAGGRRVALS